MLDAYKKQVLLAYQKKRESGQLSLHLVKPSPAKLRDECIVVLQERYLKNDEKTLRLFFGPRENVNDYFQAIRKFDVDKFRPLANFLKEGTGSTEDKNIELLAWLINFEPRPYQYGYQPPYNELEETLVDVEAPEEIAFPTIVVPQSAPTAFTSEPVATLLVDLKKVKISKKLRAVILMICLFACATGASYWYWPTADEGNSITTDGCMFWIKDHYEPISCAQSAAHTGVIPFDKNRLSRFKRITDTNSLTETAVGRVWYFKRKDHLELYTAAGFHPVDTTRWLKPLTKYMLDKYILRKRMAASEK